MTRPIPDIAVSFVAEKEALRLGESAIRIAGVWDVPLKHRPRGGFLDGPAGR